MGTLYREYCLQQQSRCLPMGTRTAICRLFTQGMLQIPRWMGYNHAEHGCRFSHGWATTHRTWLSINPEGNWLLLIPPQPDRAHVNISSPDFKGRCHPILSSWLACEFHVYSLLAFQFAGCISKKMDQETPVDEGREANTRTLMTALFTTETNKWTKAKQLNSTHRGNESISVYQRHRVLGRRWEESEGRGCQ